MADPEFDEYDDPFLWCEYCKNELIFDPNYDSTLNEKASNRRRIICRTENCLQPPFYFGLPELWSDVEQGKILFAILNKRQTSSSSVYKNK
jgi:hypothetical protein